MIYKCTDGKKRIFVMVKFAFDKTEMIHLLCQSLYAGKYRVEKISKADILKRVRASTWHEGNMGLDSYNGDNAFDANWEDASFLIEKYFGADFD